MYQSTNLAVQLRPTLLCHVNGNDYHKYKHTGPAITGPEDKRQLHMRLPKNLEYVQARELKTLEQDEERREAVHSSCVET